MRPHPRYTDIVRPGQQGEKHWTKQVGRLNTKDEKLSRALTVPSNFAKIVLGFDLYDKQKKALDLCAPIGSMVSIAAANGSGKTSRILPSLVLWHQSLWPMGKVKITSGSWTQIEDQIWPAIVRHKESFPKWKWLETPYVETYSSWTTRPGWVRAFSTNHPGKAEGDHPDGDDTPLLFIVDEAKTAPDWLRKVLEGRVRPTRLVLMSSHGFSEGWFFESQRMMGDKFKTITITADDCPHISKEEIEQVRKDFAGQPEFVDSVLGYDFMPLVEDAVINGRALDDCLNNPPIAKSTGEQHAFCDFSWSGSGAENVIALRRGNIVTIEKAFHCGHLVCSKKNPEPGICEQFIGEFLRLGLVSNQISGDEGGGGKLVMDELDRMGWYLNRVNNGAPAEDSEHYANVGAEMWYEGGKHITLKTYVLPNDRVLRAQLLSRKRVRNDKGKLAIEPKEEMRKRNVSSPDRADAVLGCLLPGGGFGNRGISWAQPMGVGKYQTMYG